MYQKGWFVPLIHHTLKKHTHTVTADSEGNDENNIDTANVQDRQIIWETLSVTSWRLAYRGELGEVSKPPTSGPSHTLY